MALGSSLNKTSTGFRYAIFITVFVMCVLGFLRMVIFVEDTRETPDDQKYLDLSMRHSMLSTRLKQVERELAQTRALFNRTTHPSSNTESDSDTQTPNEGGKFNKSEDTGNTKDVITNYDSLVFFQKYFNTHGEVLNKDKFELADDFIPIVIRVFDKHDYIKYVLEHYKNVKGINETILVISHDGIFPEVFKQIEAVDFCQVKQVIHPYSGHTLTNRFPGKDPTLPHHVDQYGNPRPFPHTALKHHYWWHLNTAWDVLFPSHTGDIMLMEEDHVPTVDFYITLKNLVKIRDKECPNDCFNVQMHEHGIYSQMQPTGSVHDLVQSGMFGNIGISFNRKNFIKVKNAAQVFCTFDEYNWDWSMIYLQTQGHIPKDAMVPVIPRAVHLGTCGTHFRGHSCDIDDRDVAKIEKYNNQIAQDHGEVWEKYQLRNAKHLFSGHSKGYGGWAHPADHAHCLAQVRPNPNFANEEKLPTQQ